MFPCNECAKLMIQVGRRGRLLRRRGRRQLELPEQPGPALQGVARAAAHPQPSSGKAALGTGKAEGQRRRWLHWRCRGSPDCAVPGA